jgi:hypothetical protein
MKISLGRIARKLLFQAARADRWGSKDRAFLVYKRKKQPLKPVKGFEGCSGKMQV